VCVDRPDDHDPRLEPADAHEAPEPEELDSAGTHVPGERADNRSRLESRADLGAEADAAYRAYAIDHGCDRVRKIEGTVVTPALREIEAKDAVRRLIGLEFRLKGEGRLAEKVTSAVAEQPDLSYEKAFALVKDAIRYTFEYPDDRYVAG
jgi:hypothetical protein